MLRARLLQAVSAVGFSALYGGLVRRLGDGTIGRKQNPRAARNLLVLLELQTHLPALCCPRTPGAPTAWGRRSPGEGPASTRGGLRKLLESHDLRH